MGKSGDAGEVVGKEDATFTGSFFRSLDAKGRLTLPPPFLQALSIHNESSPALWLTAFYGRLVAYLPENWRETVAQFAKIAFPSPRLANFKTKLIGLAEELQPDMQGRIRLSKPLMREAGLNKEIVLVGMLDKFEIWSRERFEALPDEDVSEELHACGITIIL